MKLDYFHIIITIIFVILIIYQITNRSPPASSPPPPPPPPPPSKKPITHTSKLTTVYTPSGPNYPLSASIEINVITTTATVTNTIHPSSSTIDTSPSFWGTFTQYPTSTLSIGGIQYDGNYLNFYEQLSGSSTRMAISNATTYGLTINDTSTNQLVYDTTTASISGKTLTFEADTGTLTIIFS